MPKKAFKCLNCNRIYMGNGFKMACTRECYYRKEYETMMKKEGSRSKYNKVRKCKLYEKICALCHLPFQCNSKRKKYCSLGCSTIPRQRNQTIQEANERWLNSKPSKRICKSPFRLSKEESWRHLYDDDSWVIKFNTLRG